MVNINEEQITRLKTQAEKFGGVDSQQFKDKVNTQYGAGSYDKLVKNVAGSIQSGTIQGNMENANKIIPTQAPIQTPTQPVGIQAQVNTPTLPEPTPIQTETPVTTSSTKTETNQTPVKIESIEQFKQKGANLPNLEQFIEDRYGSTATQEDGGVTSVINGEKFKWTIDSQGNPIKTSMGKVQQDMSAMDNADTLYTSLLSGQVIPESLKTSNNYVKAQNRFNQYTQYKNLNQSQYQQLLAQGKLIPGTQAYNDLMNDPVAKSNIIKAQNLNAINQNQKAEEKVVSTEENQSKVILNNNPTVAQALEDGSLSAEEYQSLTSSPDIVQKQKDVSQLKEEYIRLKSDYDAVEDDVNAELSGKGLSTSYINAKISERRKSLYKGLSLSEQLYSSAMGELTSMKDNATALLETNLKLYAQKQSQDQALAEEQRQRQYQLEDRQYQEQQATKQLEQKYAYEYGDLNSTNPTLQNIAIERAVAGMYQNYPIPGMESQATKVQKVKNLIAQGMDGTQAITQVENEIRNSQRYKDYLASEKAKITPTSTQDWAKLSDGTLYNQRTGETRAVGTLSTGGLGDLRSLASQFPGQAWAKNNNPAGITWNSNFDNLSGTASLLKEAGINFTKGTSRPASEGGNYVSFDTIEDGLKAQRIIMTQTYGNSTVEQMLGKWVGTGEALNYAKQVAGNAGIDLKAKVSDLSDSEVSQLQLAKIQKESPGLFKILSETGTKTQYSDAQLGLLSTIDNLTPTTLKALGEAGLTSEDYGLFKNGGLPPTSSQKSSAKSMVNTINDLLTNDNLSDAVGPFDVRTPVLSGKTQGFINKFNTLSANLTKDNLGVLKGPMSDKDIEFVKQMSGETQLNTDEETFKQNLIKLRDKYQTIADGKSLNQEILNGTQNTGTSTGNTYNVNGKQVNENDLFDSIYNG